MNEVEILQRYDRYLCKQAHAFYRLSRQHTLTVDDFIQEARLAFLQHIRTHDQPMWAACTLTVKGALMECVRRNYPLTVSRNNFSKTLKAGLSFTSLDRITNEHGTAQEDDYSGIDVTNFIDQLSEYDQGIIAKRLEGWSIVEIGKQMGTTRGKVAYHLDAIRRKIIV